MQYFASLRRSIVVTLSLLSACAATDGTSRAATGMPATPGKPAAVAAAPTTRTMGAAGDYLVGEFAQSRNDLNTAADELLRALAHDPGNPELQRAAFDACLLDGRPEAVRLAQSRPDSLGAVLLLGDTDVKNGNWDRARAHFAALPRQGVGEVLQPLLIAWTQQGAGNTDGAMATLKPAIDGQRFRAVYALHGAMIADLAGRDAEAGRLYEVARAEYGTTNLELARTLASWQTRQGRPAEAAQTLDALVGGNADLALIIPALKASASVRPVSHASDGIASAYVAAAAALRNQGGDDLAHVMLRLALDLRPDYTAARLLLADLLAAGKHPGAALATLAPVAANDPLSAIVRLRRAGLLEETGATDEALALLAQLATEFPDQPEPLATEGDILRDHNRFPEAVTAYDAAIERVRNPDQSTWPLFYERGVSLERAHQWPKAETDFKRALQLAPDQPVVLNYLGYSWADQGRNLPQAREMIQRALDQRPNDGAILDSMGWVELKQGHVQQAVKLLERAAELMPEDSTVNGHLGDAYQAADRHLEAQYQWRLALTLKPEPEDVPKLEAKLKDGTTAQASGPAKTVQ